MGFLCESLMNDEQYQNLSRLILFVVGYMRDFCCQASFPFNVGDRKLMETSLFSQESGWRWQKVDGDFIFILRKVVGDLLLNVSVISLFLKHSRHEIIYSFRFPLWIMILHFLGICILRVSILSAMFVNKMGYRSETVSLKIWLIWEKKKNLYKKLKNFIL